MPEENFYLTKEGLERIKKEYQSLRNLKKIKSSRENILPLEGENANPAYLSLQEDLEILERKTEELENILKNYQIIKFPPKAKQNIVDLGAKVFLEDSSGQKVKFQIVGTLEANPFLEKISNESPVGKALLGCKVGEKVDIDSPVKLEYKILKITYEES